MSSKQYEKPSHSSLLDGCRADESLDNLAGLCQIQTSEDVTFEFEVEVADDRSPGQFLQERRRFYELLNAEISRSNRGLSIVSLVLLRWSEERSNESVSKLAGALRNALREYDVACRITADTLALIMPGTSEGDCAAVVRRLCQSVARALQVGWATWVPGLDAMELLAGARANLLEADDLVTSRQDVRPKSRILMWIDGFPCALPVQADPRPGGLELRVMLPALSGREIRLSGGPVSWPCKVDEISFDDGETLRMRVTGVPQ